MNVLLRYALALASASLCCQALAAPCQDTFDPASPVLSVGFGSGMHNTRNVPSKITSANVGGLKLVLSHGDTSATERRTAPVVTQQAVVLTSGRKVIAMNRASGCTYWTYEVENKSTFLIGKNTARSSSLAYVREAGLPPVIAVGDFFAKVHALDARTGKPLWVRFLGHDTKNSMITGGLEYADGKLFVPISTKETFATALDFVGSCCVSHGMLHVVDPYSGHTRWVYETASKATRDWWKGTSGPSGMAMWGNPTIDLARRQVYVGTGQNLSLPLTSNSDAIIALDLDSGRVKWTFQGRADDAWNAKCGLPEPLNRKCPTSTPHSGDQDFGAPAILATGASGRQVLLAGQKSSVVFAIDPDTGRQIWQRRLGMGAALGGVHWGMAIDHRNVYVGITDLSVNKLSRLSLGDLGAAFGSVNLDDLFSQGLGVAGSAGMTLEEGATPGLYALDIDSGALVWSRRPMRSLADGRQVPVIFSAALSVTNDVLLASGLDGVLRALRTDTGEEIWRYDTAKTFTDTQGNPGKGGSMDSVGAIVAGDQIFANSGYGAFGDMNDFLAGAGSALFVFGLP